MVLDIGGTTSDIGCLVAGFPREANNVVEIGGVRTLFRMPDLLSIGIGGILLCPSLKSCQRQGTRIETGRHI